MVMGIRQDILKIVERMFKLKYKVVYLIKIKLFNKIIDKI